MAAKEASTQDKWYDAEVIAPIIMAAYLILSLGGNYVRQVLARRRLRLQGSAPPANGVPGQFLAWDILVSSHLTEGYLVGPAILLVVRLLVVALFAVSIVVDDRSDNLNPHFLTWFTNWTVILSGLAALLGSVLCIQKLQRQCLHNSSSDEEFPNRWSLLQRTFQLSFVVSLASGIMLAAFYWAVLNEPGDNVDFADVAKHGGLQLLLVVDLLLSRIPAVWYQFPVVALYQAIYVAFMWIFSELRGKPRYEELDIKDDSSVRWYLVLPVLGIAAYCVVYLLGTLRDTIGNIWCMRRLR